MRLSNRPNRRISRIPGTMDVVGHNIEPVDDGVDGYNVEVAHVPVRRWLKESVNSNQWPRTRFSYDCD